jgi:HAD superfamily hydrolase (TIGR01509 family)
MKTKAIVFDLDGTLVNSMPLVLSGYAHAIEGLHVPMTEGEIIARLGGPPDRFFAQILSDPARIVTALDRLERYFRKHGELIQPFEGATELLEFLRRRSVRVGIWTGRERASAEQIMTRHGIADQIDVAVFGDDLPTHKPDPAGLDEVLRRLEIERGDALFVGDADVDVLAGHEIGVTTLLIRHGRQVAPEIQSKAARVVEMRAEMYSILRDTVTASTGD